MDPRVFHVGLTVSNVERSLAFYRDIVGMARYRVLLRAGLVEEPRVAFARNAVEGGHDLMRIDNTTVRITAQPGLNPRSRDWHPGEAPAGGTIGAPP